MLSNTISASDDVRVFSNDTSGTTSGGVTENLPEYTPDLFSFGVVLLNL